jgi:DNA-binding IscR family transcriptional regulator
MIFDLSAVAAREWPLGTNPSLVRKLLSHLADAGLVRSSFGRDGGIRLGHPADAITLRDVYNAVLAKKSLWTPRAVPHRCLVSSNVERYFVDLAARWMTPSCKRLNTRVPARDPAR